jgi:apolipoprotein N-acyltransferase
LPFALALGGGVVAFLGFAGFDIWPFAFVAFVPLLAAMELERSRRTRRIVGIAWLYGFVGIAGGYYWIVDMLGKFSGFGTVPNVLIASVLFVYLGGMFALFGWLWWRATSRGYNATLSAVLAWASVELLYPNLFPYYYGASFHNVPILLQIAELGGPILVGALCLAVNGTLFEIGRAWVQRRRLPRLLPGVVATCVLATLGYGAIRMQQVDARSAEAPKLDVGLVQVNMGIFAKRESPREGHRRHLEQTRELERKHDLDLVVWPESAFGYTVPGDVDNLRKPVMGPVETPLFFGGLSSRREDDRRKLFNTAFLLDSEGNIQGTYDKTYLLAFGEYIPFGETFPILYEWSPNTGRFTPGDHVKPLHLNDWRISALICYEDILPSFVRDAVLEGDPHLLVNITNDAWFGDTHEPWIHLALAQFRSIETRRALVRTTNSGVSAVVDPAGRVMTHSGVFERANLHAEVPMLHGLTPFTVVGNYPWWLAVGAIGWLAFGRRGRRAHSSGGKRSR